MAISIPQVQEHDLAIRNPNVAALEPAVTDASISDFRSVVHERPKVDRSAVSIAEASKKQQVAHEVAKCFNRHGFRNGWIRPGDPEAVASASFDKLTAATREYVAQRDYSRTFDSLSESDKWATEVKARELRKYAEDLEPAIPKAVDGEDDLLRLLKLPTPASLQEVRKTFRVLDDAALGRRRDEHGKVVREKGAHRETDPSIQGIVRYAALATYHAAMGAKSKAEQQLESRVNPRRNMAGAAQELTVKSPESRAITSEADVVAEMQTVTGDFMATVNATPPIEPAPGEARDTEMIVYLSAQEAASGAWHPNRVLEYASFDPYQKLNPVLTQATTDLIERTMGVTDALGTSQEPTLAYLDSRRARNGKNATIVTKMLAACDQTMGQWMNRLPNAECLRPVAHPWADLGMVVWDEATKTFQELKSSPALLALAGGSNDGRAVREREAWERMMIKAFVAEHPDEHTLRLTSLGTGTGEPAIDSGLAAMKHREGRLEVHGVDAIEESLRVAEHIAEQKQSSVGPGSLHFEGHFANLLSEEKLAEVVSKTEAHVYEAIGFAEYVPSEYASNEAERHMRAVMGSRNLLSAEGFYKTIYDNMPAGSILVTGNMRDDSPQGRFVTEGLGWPLIIERSTEEYLSILRNAGIPGEAVELFVPGSKSAGVYNLVKITKL